MRARERAIQEIIDWLAAGKERLHLKCLKYDPLAPVRADMLNAIHIHCTTDKTVKQANRGPYGFPRVQEASLVFECWLKKDCNYVEFYEHWLWIMCNGQFKNRFTNLILEEKVGPFDGGVEGAFVLQLHAKLRYVDDGFVKN